MMPVSTSTKLEQLLADASGAVEGVIEQILTSNDEGLALPLWEAMRYAALSGGKRLRPFLVTASASLFGVPGGRALRAAAAVEMVHCYSLIHDDLPAMDNSDYRRGRQAVHRRFDEATAILAGDGLLTVAFEVISDGRTHPDPEIRCALVSELARAAGPVGMVGGQMMDLSAEQTDLDLSQVGKLQQAKTGALMVYCARAGAILGEGNDNQCRDLARYAGDLGAAFQIADDLLDVQGSQDRTGKPVGQDNVAGKKTFVSMLGADKAREQAYAMAERAAGWLRGFGSEADSLRCLPGLIVERVR